MCDVTELNFYSAFYNLQYFTTFFFQLVLYFVWKYTSLRSPAFNRLQPAMNFSSSNFSTQNSFEKCLTVPTVTYNLTAFCIINDLLIIPLYVIVLYLGFHQWKKCCFPSTLTTSRHSNLVTYNMVAMALIEVSAVHFYLVGEYTASSELLLFGFLIFTTCWYGKVPFHTLTCIECYMAVVHPVKYLGLKNKTGSQIRASIIVCIWLQLFLLAGLLYFLSQMLNIILFTFYLSFAFIVIFFCCVSVLWELKQPVSGQASREREQVHQIKRKAFFTLLTIMCAVLFTLLWVLLFGLLFNSTDLKFEDKCLLLGLVSWFCLPCNVVLPLLYLQRARKQL